jgi:hypothetical protein
MGGPARAPSGERVIVAALGLGLAHVGCQASAEMEVASVAEGFYACPLHSVHASRLAPGAPAGARDASLLHDLRPGRREHGFLLDVGVLDRRPSERAFEQLEVSGWTLPNEERFRNAARTLGSAYALVIEGTLGIPRQRYFLGHDGRAGVVAYEVAGFCADPPGNRGVVFHLAASPLSAADWIGWTSCVERAGFWRASREGGDIGNDGWNVTLAGARGPEVHAITRWAIDHDRIDPTLRALAPCLEALEALAP